MAFLRKASKADPRNARLLDWRCLGFLVLAWRLLTHEAWAQPPVAEYQVKAAFLLNFVKFVEWPASAFSDSTSPIAICILGDDPFGGTLDQLTAGESVNGRKLVTQRLKHTPSAHACQVLFIGKSEKDAGKILPTLGPGVLTVGEGEGFAHNGGMIGFVIEDRRVRFDINQSVAANAMLTLSSRLLSVARSVEK